MSSQLIITLKTFLSYFGTTYIQVLAIIKLHYLTDDGQMFSTFDFQLRSKHTFANFLCKHFDSTEIKFVIILI